jgi:hypothetical protein
LAVLSTALNGALDCGCELFDWANPREGTIESKSNRIKYRRTVDLKDELGELAILGPAALDGQGQRRLGKFCFIVEM